MPPPRPARPIPDAGFLAALLLAALAAWPLLTRPGLPTATDAELHIYRADQVLRAWAGGVAYPRWAPDLAFGYGYPVLNYYAPLAYHLSAAYGLFFGGAVAGVKFTLVAATTLGALGVYGLARELWDAPGALAAAAAFTLSPYLIYLNPVARGAAPEALAVGLSPWPLWAFTRLWRAPTPAAFAAAAISLAALLLAHNLLSLIFSGLLLVWIGGRLVFDPPGHGRRRSLAWAVSALVIGVGLAAFFWLPAALERGQVQFQRAFAFVQDPRNPLRLVPAAELLAPALPADLADPTTTGWRFRLGVPQWLLALAGGLALVRARERRPLAAGLALAAIGSIGLVLPAAEPIWRGLPVLLYLQLPWRLLGPAALALALLAGAAVTWLPRRHDALALAAVAGCLLGAWPLLNPLPWADFGPVTLTRLLTYERQGNLGTTAQNEFLPAGVQAMPPPRDDYLQAAAAGVVDKVDRAALPTEAEVVQVAHGPAQDTFSTRSPNAFRLTVLTFYFPGWRAVLDGAPATLRAAAPDGFILVEMPAGEHTLTLRFQDTPARRLGWVISGLALSGGLALVWRWRQVLAPGLSPEPASWRLAAGAVALLLAALGARWSADRAAQTEAEPAALPSQAFLLEGNLALAGYDLPSASARPGESVPLTLHWQATGPAPRDLSVFVHLIGPDGQVWGQSDKSRPAADWPTSRWPRGRVFADAHQVSVRPEAPPGPYTFKVGLWDSLTGARLWVLNAGGAPGELDGIMLPTPFTIEP